MLTTKDLASSFARNLDNLRRVTENLADADCLCQPPFNSNCMSWVLGHILTNRDRVLRFLGEERILTDEQSKRYGYGSSPICAAGPDVLSLKTMLELLEASQPRIEEGLARIGQDALGEEVEYARRKVTVEQALLMTVAHDYMHFGELTILRELALSCRPDARSAEIDISSEQRQ